MEFYLGFYDLLKEDLLMGAHESSPFGKVIGAFKSIFITLIPTKQDAISFQDFRPISLCNLIYKLISKTIANRLKGILLGIIS